MKRDPEVERKFIKSIAMKVRNEEYIVAALHSMDSDEKRITLIEFLKDNPDAGMREIDEKMFFLSICSKLLRGN